MRTSYLLSNPDGSMELCHVNLLLLIFYLACVTATVVYIGNSNKGPLKDYSFQGNSANTFYDAYTGNGFKYFWGCETSDANKGAHQNEYFEPITTTQECYKLDEFWTKEAFVESDTLHSDKSPGVNPKSGSEHENMGFGGSVINNVRIWVEQLRFAKCVGLCEMHEVDEALPLLTIEDHKVMGTNTVFSEGVAVSAWSKLSTAASFGKIIVFKKLRWTSQVFVQIKMVVVSVLLGYSVEVI
ncbi:hypothetical protein NE237_023006 [Protea cynaroides]|uniref:Uncharacterized protein n=1 Tax=Protea cynaroides TaxID=273540 RepID=A0A9Q0HAY0_9MAGN|nr:hypothetical protein NE237_023006 [Protea cynaroides]